MKIISVLLRLSAVLLLLLVGMAMSLAIRILQGPQWSLSPFGAGFRQWWMKAACVILNVKSDRYGLAAKGPVLIAANHISWVDIVVIGASTRCVFVAKQNVNQWPFIGTMARLSGTIFVDRDNPRNSMNSLNEVIEVLNSGSSVVVFPEGTSTATTQVKPFYSLLFEAAVQSGCNVQAVALNYPNNMNEGSHVPFIGDQSFGPHLVSFLTAGKTVAEVYFCGQLKQDPKLNRKDYANLSHHQVSQILNYCEDKNELADDEVETSFRILYETELELGRS